MLLTFSQTLQSVQGITWKKQGTGQGFYGLLYHKIPKIYCKASGQRNKQLTEGMFVFSSLGSILWAAGQHLQEKMEKRRYELALLVPRQEQCVTSARRASLEQYQVCQ